jgi:hypothetical protein
MLFGHLDPGSTMLFGHLDGTGWRMWTNGCARVGFFIKTLLRWLGKELLQFRFVRVSHSVEIEHQGLGLE